MQEFVLALLRVQASYRQAIYKEIRENNIDLTFEMLHIIKQLYNHKRVNQQELANITFKDKSNLSYLLSNMEKRSLIRRVADNLDKRSKLIILTQEGEKQYLQAKKIVDNVYVKVEHNIETDRMERCTNYLTQLNDIISHDL